MAMTKKEREEMEMLRTELALRFTPAVKKDLPPPPSGKGLILGLSCGYSYNAYTLRVHKTCSSHLYHGNDWDKTTSQKPIWQFSSELLAYKAMRNEVEYECAEKLRRIDRCIEELEKTEPFGTTIPNAISGEV